MYLISVYVVAVKDTFMSLTVRNLVFLVFIFVELFESEKFKHYTNMIYKCCFMYGSDYEQHAYLYKYAYEELKHVFKKYICRLIKKQLLITALAYICI